MPRQNTPPSEYPQAVIREIERLAQNIVIARKRRGETQAQWAKKLGVSQPTMARIERGDPSVAMASYVMSMWLVNQAEGLADLISPVKDHAALEREVQRLKPLSKSSAARVMRGYAPENADVPAHFVASEVRADALHSPSEPKKPEDRSEKRRRGESRENRAPLKSFNPNASGLAALMQPKSRVPK